MKGDGSFLNSPCSGAYSRSAKPKIEWPIHFASWLGCRICQAGCSRPAANEQAPKYWRIMTDADLDSPHSTQLELRPKTFNASRRSKQASEAAYPTNCYYLNPRPRWEDSSTTCEAKYGHVTILNLLTKQKTRLIRSCRYGKYFLKLQIGHRTVMDFHEKE